MRVIKKMETHGQACGTLRYGQALRGLPVERNPAPENPIHPRVSPWFSGARINPEIPLRLGFGLMYFYSGLDLMRNPAHWYGFAPAWLERAVGTFLSMDSYLWLQGIGELIIAFLLLAWFLHRWSVRLASLLALIEMIGILLFVGIDPITFRDIGLLGGLASLWVLSSEK